MANIYYVLLPASTPVPSGPNIVNGYPDVAVGSGSFDDTNGVSGIAVALRGVRPTSFGKLKAAMVWYDGTNYSNVVVTDTISIAPTLTLSKLNLQSSTTAAPMVKIG